MAERPKPYPDISPHRNKAVMDVNLNSYDLAFVKPIADKVDLIKPVVFVQEDHSEVEIEKIVVSDYNKAKYDPVTKTLTLDITSVPAGAISFTDLIGVPPNWPTAADLETGNKDPNAKSSAMILVAKEDGIYFENHNSGVELTPRKSRMKSVNKLDELERRLMRLEKQLK